jgi:hypothetical protein
MILLGQTRMDLSKQFASLLIEAENLFSLLSASDVEPAQRNQQLIESYLKRSYVAVSCFGFHLFAYDTPCCLLRTVTAPLAQARGFYGFNTKSLQSQTQYV